jgi:hypothetical protein
MWLCAGDFDEVLFHHEKEGASQELKLAWPSSTRASWKCVIFMIWVLLEIFLLGKINKQKGARTHVKG